MLARSFLSSGGGGESVVDSSTSGEVDMRRDDDNDVFGVWVMCWAPMNALCERIILDDEHADLLVDD